MSEKRQQLINTALGLFYHQGIHQIGINEILTLSGVAKRTLYKHFASKEALILAALEQRHCNFMQWLEKEISTSTSDRDLIEKLFDALKQWFLNQATELGEFRGCFFINTAAEFSDIDSQIAQYCAFHKAKVRALIQSKLSNNNPLLLDAICIMKEGAINIAHMTREKEQVCLQSKAVLHALCP